ncbi:hypothetical protein NC652_029288 [Populus alba x Populus x berolinensis]|nr:hypothetical protein NC652_029288 [Populus alba x Populus x berolinensis]
MDKKAELIEDSREGGGGGRRTASGEVVERAECGHCGTWEERGLVGVVFVRKQSRMIKQGSRSRELKLLRGFRPPLERLQMLDLPFTWLNPLSNSSRRSCPPLLLQVPLP